MIPNAGEAMEDLELSYFTDENAKWFSHFVKLAFP